MMSNDKIIPIEDRIPKLKQNRRKRANRLFVMYILIFFILMVGIIYFQSPLSEVSEIHIKGNRYVSEGEIINRSKIKKGDGFWKIDLEETSHMIESHPEIAKVRSKRSYPNKISIQITERKRIGYLMEGSTIYPILDNGVIMRKRSVTSTPGDAPIFINWENGDAIQEMAAQLTKIPEEINNLISEIKYDPTPSDPMHITLFMNDGYKVSATIRNFSEKVTAYPSIVENIPEGTKGVIDLEVGYYFRPYDNLDREEAVEYESNR
jgi:cell division protein FtsQ